MVEAEDPVIPEDILDSSVMSLEFCYREYLVLEVTSELGAMNVSGACKELS